MNNNPDIYLVPKVSVRVKKVAQHSLVGKRILYPIDNESVKAGVTRKNGVSCFFIEPFAVSQGLQIFFIKGKT